MPAARFVVPTCLLVAALSATAAVATAQGGRSEPLTYPEPVVTDAPDVVPLEPEPMVTADAGWVRRTAGLTGIEERALQAYATVALRLESEAPGCRLGWATLAGIGHVETGHGQGTLDADGRTTESIHGPELDGTGGYAAIPGEDGWDRARGPMQFIDSTWRTWAADGDGDGTADVDDVDDAAYAAGRYLCHAGGDLSTPEGWTRAVHAYNHSDAYVQAVLGAANTYAARSR